jgi:predicted DNA-binding transcriptional regulator AlpA
MKKREAQENYAINSEFSFENLAWTAQSRRHFDSSRPNFEIHAEDTLRPAKERNMAHRGADQAVVERLLHSEEVSTRLGVSPSWLAKSRMRGDGPPFIQIGRSIRYSEVALQQWLKSRQRLSTSDQS